MGSGSGVVEMILRINLTGTRPKYTSTRTRTWSGVQRMHQCRVSTGCSCVFMDCRGVQGVYLISIFVFFFLCCNLWFRDFDTIAKKIVEECQRRKESCKVVSVDIVGRGKSDWLQDSKLYGYPTVSYSK
jgi:hypothetical protein